MKKPIYLLLIFALFGGCQPKTSQPIPVASTQPELLPVPAFGANHQAPFGYDTVKVKLREITLDGRLASRFQYKVGYLSELVRYVTYNNVKPWATVAYERNNGVPGSFEARTSTATPDGTTLPNLPTKGVFGKYVRPDNDATREIYQPYGATSIYSMNAKGFVTKVFQPAGSLGTTTYDRDGSNNVGESTSEYLSNPFPSKKKQYEYDNHPNPFHDLGIDHFGGISQYSLSPNNVVEEKGDKLYNYGAEPIDAIIHEYEYLPNGYPKKDAAYFLATEADGTIKKGILYVMEYKYY